MMAPLQESDARRPRKYVRDATWGCSPCRVAAADPFFRRALTLLPGRVLFVRLFGVVCLFGWCCLCVVCLFGVVGCLVVNTFSSTAFPLVEGKLPGPQDLAQLCLRMPRALGRRHLT
jgi:hypothetical protein